MMHIARNTRSLSAIPQLFFCFVILSRVAEGRVKKKPPREYRKKSSQGVRVFSKYLMKLEKQIKGWKMVFYFYTPYPCD